MNVSEELRDQQTIALDIKQADATYRPFPDFAEWAKSEVNSARWDRYMLLYQETQNTPEDILDKARDEVKRSAAVETGAIEGLYDSHRGITFTAGVEVAVWEAAINQMGERERKLIQSQLDAYDYVLDFATKQQPIAETWIRELHKVICNAQKTFRVLTEIGWQEQELPLGQYKTQPNHVVKKSNGKIHSYAPVDYTSDEMYRLCQELNSDDFDNAHPVLQSSYAHYAFVCIHPFSDGNGRVARALASVFTYRSNSIPLLITTEQKGNYLYALEAADQGSYQPFVGFILERTFDAIRLVSDSIKTATVRAPQESISSLMQLYRTKGNYTHSQVDDAGLQLLQLLYDCLDGMRGEIDQLSNQSIKYALQRDQQNYEPLGPSSRLPVKHGHQRIIVRLTSISPADGEVVFSLALEVPKDCGSDDEIILFHQSTRETYEARISEILPEVTETLRMRIHLWAKRIMGRALDQLRERAEGSLRGRGY